MGEPIISVSGLRGIVGEELSPEVAVRYAAAFADASPPGPIVMTRDGRITGPMLADVIRGSLVAMGREVIDADVAPTPTIGVLVKQLSAAGGIQISASHNPPEYNGIKLIGADGRVVSASVGEAIKEVYERGVFPWMTHEQIGRVQEGTDPAEEHLRLVLGVVDVERIRSKRFKVLLDSNHGSGSVVGTRLLEALGCEVTLLGGEPDGHIDHPAEPTETNLQDVLPKVIAAGADIGFCQDPDADRLAIIDEKGRYIGEEMTVGLCVAHRLRQQQEAGGKAGVVTNCASSRMSQDLAERFGVPFWRSKVGEANVVELMLEHEALIGGEGSGGAIDPRVVLIRDSIGGMALVLDYLAARGMPVSELADELPQYAMVKRKIALDADGFEAGLEALRKEFPQAEVSDQDGVRFDWDDRWLLVRKSNTEPIARAIAEAKTHAQADLLCQQVAEYLGQEGA